MSGKMKWWKNLSHPEFMELVLDLESLKKMQAAMANEKAMNELYKGLEELEETRGFSSALDGFAKEIAELKRMVKHEETAQDIYKNGYLEVMPHQVQDKDHRWGMNNPLGRYFIPTPFAVALRQYRRLRKYLSR